MKKIPRRDKMKIYGDVLLSLQAEARRGKIVLSRVQLKTNVPYDRLIMYLDELKNLGLVIEDGSPKLTEKGRQYLKEYEKVLSFMKRMGLIYQ